MNSLISKIPDWLKTVLSTGLYLIILIAIAYIFDNYNVSPSLTLPFVFGFFLTMFGGFVAGMVNSLLLIILTVYLFHDDPTRLYQNVALNSVILFVTGWQSASRTQQKRLAQANQAKATLLDNANGNIVLIEQAYLLVESAKQHYPGDTDDKSYIAIIEARGILANLQTMVKGWRALYREKIAVKEKFEAQHGQ